MQNNNIIEILKLILFIFMIFTITNCKSYPPSIMPYDMKLQELYDQLFLSLPEWTGENFVWKGDYERKEHIRKLREKIFKYFPEWNKNQKAAILESKVIKEMDEWQVLAALGAPEKSDFYDFLLDKTISKKGVEKVLRYWKRGFENKIDLKIIFFNNRVTHIEVNGVDSPVFYIREE